MLRPATPLTILLLVAFGLLVLSIISTPIVKFIPLASFAGIDFGVFGFCKGNECSPIELGYDTSTLFNDAQSSTFDLPSSTRATLSSILIVHPLAALLTLIMFILAASAHFPAPSHSPRYLLALFILSILTVVTALLSFLIDVLLFVPHMAWGSYSVLVATILIAVSGLISCAMRRALVSRKARKKRIAENAEMNGENFYNRIQTNPNPVSRDTAIVSSAFGRSTPELSSVDLFKREGDLARAYDEKMLLTPKFDPVKSFSGPVPTVNGPNRSNELPWAAESLNRNRQQYQMKNTSLSHPGTDAQAPKYSIQNWQGENLPPSQGPGGILRTQENYSTPRGGLEPKINGFRPPGGAIGPPRGGYGPPRGGFGSQRGAYGPATGGYGSSTGNYKPQGRGYELPGRGFESSGRGYKPSGRGYEPMGKNMNGVGSMLDHSEHSQIYEAPSVNFDGQRKSPPGSISERNSSLTPNRYVSPAPTTTYSTYNPKDDTTLPEAESPPPLPASYSQNLESTDSPTLSHFSGLPRLIGDSESDKRSSTTTNEPQKDPRLPTERSNSKNDMSYKQQPRAESISEAYLKDTSPELLHSSNIETSNILRSKNSYLSIPNGNQIKNGLITNNVDSGLTSQSESEISSMNSIPQGVINPKWTGGERRETPKNFMFHRKFSQRLPLDVNSASPEYTLADTTDGPHRHPSPVRTQGVPYI